MDLFCILVAPENTYPKVCPKIDTHFWEMENMPKVSILHCKIVFLHIWWLQKMHIPQVCTRSRDIHCWEKKICKQFPFYSVKLFFLRFWWLQKMHIPQVCLRGRDIHFWKICKKNILQCKIDFVLLFWWLQKMHIPQVCPRSRDIHCWGMENM